MPCHPATSRHVGTGIPGTATQGFSAQGPLCVSFRTCCGAAGRGQNQRGGGRLEGCWGGQAPGRWEQECSRQCAFWWAPGGARHPRALGSRLAHAGLARPQALHTCWTHRGELGLQIHLPGCTGAALGPHWGRTGAALGLRPGCGCTGRGQSLPGRETLMVPRQRRGGWPRSPCGRDRPGVGPGAWEVRAGPASRGQPPHSRPQRLKSSSWTDTSFSRCKTTHFFKKRPTTTA